MPGSDDQVFIGMYDDMYIKYTSSGREKVLYRELPEKASFISKFEAKNIIKINKYFISALDVFENLLQKNNWGRCLYFDAYFPHFLSGYYSLICAARNSDCALPISARVPEQEFDVSLSSPKTDARINRWRSAPDTIIKLRIACKELSHQLKLWEKNLDKVKDNEDTATPKELEEALVGFVRVYFNLKPVSTGRPQAKPFLLKPWITVQTLHLPFGTRPGCRPYSGNKIEKPDNDGKVHRHEVVHFAGKRQRYDCMQETGHDGNKSRQ